MAERDSKLQETQRNIDQVVDMMKENVNKAMERDQKISDLESKTESLKQGADMFQRQTVRVKRKMYFENVKAKVSLILLVVALLFLIIGVPIIVKTTKK